MIICVYVCRVRAWRITTVYSLSGKGINLFENKINCGVVCGGRLVEQRVHGQVVLNQPVVRMWFDDAIGRYHGEKNGFSTCVRVFLR